MGPSEALIFLRDRDEQMIMAVYGADSDVCEVVANLDWSLLELTDGAYIPASRKDKDGVDQYCGVLYRR